MKMIALLTILVTIVLIAGCTQYGSLNPTPTTTGTNAVSIKSFAFNPANLTVKVGTTVTWTNEDTASHTIVSDTGSEISSNSLSNGQNYSHTFNTVGNFDYHCSIHPSMKAKIIVE
ncbi:MAG: cupredoxin family copper-binding protein [Candidatus Aenigmatarchaeota archaeon]